MSQHKPSETSAQDSAIDTWIAGLQAQRETIEKAQDQWHAFASWMSAGQIEALRSRAADCLGGPLAGAAVAVKDILDTAHLPTSYGSPIYQGHRPASPSAVAQAIERAGGVVLGKSVTTEFAFLEPPPTRNPRAPHLTPGGSSSGSVAAIAAGLVRFAVGTQTGGSIIRPASYCGVVGFKPSFGLINTAGLKPFSSSLDTVGLFAASAGDCALLARALMPLAPEQAPRAPRLGFIRHYPWGNPSPEYQDELERVIARLKDAGAQVVELELPALIGEVYEAHAVVQGYEAWRALAWEFDHRSTQLSDLLRSYLSEQQDITVAQYHSGLRIFEQGRLWADDLFSSIDGLLSAAAPGVAPDPSSTGTSSFNRVWTALGVPAITLPIARQVQGTAQPLPLGLQIIGGRYRDAALLSTAVGIEQWMV